MSDLPPDLPNRGLRYALALTGDLYEAEEVLQDAWAAVLRARGPLEPAYLFRAIRTRWIDRHRRRTARPVELQDVELGIRPAVERLIDADAVWAGLMALRPDEREVLYLFLVEGWTSTEIADRTNRPVNTVLSLIHRGRKKLGRWLDTHTGLPIEEAG
jgi:RNA polymerase sigma-70 factor (ECF subfamily)